jgi:hypothetical protein
MPIHDCFASHRFRKDLNSTPICSQSLQAAGAEVGTVTFLDADAASEMRHYISHSHVELHVEVCLYY